MKSTDYIIEQGTLPVQFRRAVRLNETTSNLTVEVKLNNRKGIFTISGKLDYNQVTGDDLVDISTIEVIADLMMEARNYALKWLEEWQKGAPAIDQMLPFPKEDEEPEPEPNLNPSNRLKGGNPNNFAVSFCVCISLNRFSGSGFLCKKASKLKTAYWLNLNPS